MLGLPQQSELACRRAQVLTGESNRANEGYIDSSGGPCERWMATAISIGVLANRSYRSIVIHTPKQLFQDDTSELVTHRGVRFLVVACSLLGRFEWLMAQTLMSSPTGKMQQPKGFMITRKRSSHQHPAFWLALRSRMTLWLVTCASKCESVRASNSVLLDSQPQFRVRHS